MTLANAEELYKHAYSAVMSYPTDMFWSETKFREREPTQTKRSAMHRKSLELHNLAEFIYVPYHRKCMFQCGPEIPR